MLKPSQINASTPTPDPLRGVTELHAQFDNAIQDAAATGRWPAVVRDSRDGALIVEIDSVIAEYRAAGWIVERGARNGVCATIDHPDRPR